jgi:hypothetical protein
MSHRIVARVSSASAITALLLSLLATPAAAATHTNRWVDDDLTAGDGPAKCDTASYSAIQDAIDDSSAGDWVYVCPGHYPEQLTIPAGVKVRARPIRQATLVAPANGTGNIVQLTGDGAQVYGMRITVETVASPPTLSQTFATCAHYSTAILALGNNNRIRDNYIAALGDSTLGGPCGFDYGIVVGNHGDPATARVTFNWVVNFKVGGILVEDTTSYAFIRRNTLRFFHQNECPPATITICAVSVSSSARPSVNDAFVLAFGIGVESDARADIIKNWIGSGPKACSTGPSYSCAPESTPVLNDGISMTGLDSSETTVVRDNVVTRTTAGIVTRVAADGAMIHDNWVSDSHYGYWPLGDNDEWHHNHTSGNDLGIDVNGSGNNIHDNDFRGNSGTDCTDHTTGSGSGTPPTANIWTNDLGNFASPDGICIPDAT